MKRQHLVLCDFDGTITQPDVTDTLLAQFSSKNWQAVGQKYDLGKITHRHMNSGFVDSLRVSEGQLQKFLDSRTWLRPGFEDFINKYQASDYKIVIVSSGWDIYIEEILKKFDFQVITSKTEFSKVNWQDSGRVILCNSAKFQGQGKWKMGNGWLSWGCQISSPCKGKILDELRPNFDQVIAIGNSGTDICMMEKSSQTFATGSLKKICQEQSINCVGFESFAEINLALGTSV